MSNYATKSDLKWAKGIDTPKFAKKFDLADSKTDADKLDIDNLKAIPVDLNKLSDVVKIKVLRKNVYDEMLKQNYCNSNYYYY